MADQVRIDRPAIEAASTTSELVEIFTHPAFWVGFIDAQRGRKFNVDGVVQRVERFTPSSALRAVGWFEGMSANRDESIAVAMFRYEEGRLMVLEDGLSVKKWDYPLLLPQNIKRFIKQTAEARSQDHAVRDPSETEA